MHWPSSCSSLPSRTPRPRGNAPGQDFGCAERYVRAMLTALAAVARTAAAMGGPVSPAVGPVPTLSLPHMVWAQSAVHSSPATTWAWRLSLLRQPPAEGCEACEPRTPKPHGKLTRGSRQLPSSPAVGPEMLTARCNGHISAR